MTRPRKKHLESGLKLTRAQRRQIEKLGAHVDGVSAGDRLYFEQHPHRTHRIRISHPCEIAQHEIIEGKSWTLPPGMRWYTVVKNVSPGVRIRLFTANYDNAPTDAVDETMAREVYARLETPHTRAFEEAVFRARANRTSTGSPVIAGIRRGPGGVASLKADWLVTVRGVCTDAPFRDRRLRNYRQFCNIIQRRFGFTFAPTAQDDWATIVETAMAETGGAA
jgi:hypothetical protein